MLSLAVIHGPNLNLLGTREPERYGRTTLAEIDAELARVAAEHGAVVSCWQGSSEGAVAADRGARRARP